MAYSEPSTQIAGYSVTNDDWNELVNDVIFLASLNLGGNAINTLSNGDSLGAVTGTYTGDGAATKAITGVGFQPSVVIVHDQDNEMGVKTDQDGTKTFRYSSYQDDHIVSLDSDGFTVGDGTASANLYNTNTTVYTYIAWR